MALLDGIPLNEQGYSSGAAFRLGEKPSESEVIHTAGEWNIELSEDSPYVVAKTEANVDSENVAEQSFRAIQQGLDIRAVSDQIHLKVDNPWNKNITWWDGKNGSYLRLYDTVELSMSTNAEATLIKDGKEVKKEPDPVKWHESFRYYRLSQLSDDVIEAYRNLFLAIEMVISSEVNEYNPPEGQWLVKSLEKVQTGSRINLESYLIDDDYDQEPAKALKNEQWNTIRNAVFHAKKQKETIQPRSSKQRSRVSRAVNQLSRLYISLVKEYLEVNIPSGGVTNKGFELMIESVFESVSIGISPQPTPKKADGVVEMSPSAYNKTTARFSDELSEGGRKVIISQFLADDMSDRKVQSFGLFDRDEDSDRILASGSLTSNLILEDVDYFKLALATQLINEKSPKSQFAT